MNKSEIFPVGSIANVDALDFKLGYEVGALPSSYLGLPLGAHLNLVNIWDGNEYKFQKRLAL